MDRLPRHKAENLPLDEARERLILVRARVAVLWLQLEPLMPAYNEHKELGGEAAILARRIVELERDARGTEVATSQRVAGMLTRLGLRHAFSSGGAYEATTSYSAVDDVVITGCGRIYPKTVEPSDADDARIAAALDAEGFIWTKAARAPHKFVVTEQKVKAAKS